LQDDDVTTVTDTINCDCDAGATGKTLATLRGDLLARLGFAAQGSSPPPGMVTLLNSFLIEAQEILCRRYEVLRTERFYSWNLQQGVRLYDLPANEEAKTLATPSNIVLANVTGSGSLSAGTYYYRVSAINANGETLASAEQSVVSVDSSHNTIGWDAVTGATGYKVYGRATGAELLIGSTTDALTFTDDGTVSPSGALPTANSTATCSSLLDPRKVTWCGVSRDDTWYPLVCGIPPRINSGNAIGWPQRYEIRQCIEIWPTPADSLGSLVIKGHFGLAPFAADSDTTTIDDRPVFLLALANAKAHYGRPDANNYIAQLETMMLNYVAGAHNTRRYIPGRPRAFDWIYTAPAPTTPFDT
jgi:hypothetical protein